VGSPSLVPIKTCRHKKHYLRPQNEYNDFPRGLGIEWMSRSTSGDRSSSLRDAGATDGAPHNARNTISVSVRLRRNRKSHNKGCHDRTFGMRRQYCVPVMVAGRRSVRQLHHASLSCVHGVERPSRMRMIIFSSEILPSRASAVRVRYFCNDKTLVYKRTIVLKKFTGFLDISQEDSTLLGSTR
jgi:hypothetical protein